MEFIVYFICIILSSIALAIAFDGNDRTEDEKEL